MACLAFIVSSPRSGSTLLTRILNSHSRLASPCEIMLPKYFVGDSAEPLASGKHSIVCRYYQVEEEKALDDSGYFMDKILAQEGKESLILKHPRYSLFIPQLSRDFPSAKFIHLVRNVRSVATSVLFQDRYIAGSNKWYLYNKAILDNTKDLGENRLFFIRYEDIISKPQKTIGELTDFLGYSFEPDMLEYGRFHHADDQMNLWNGKL